MARCFNEYQLKKRHEKEIKAIRKKTKMKAKEKAKSVTQQFYGRIATQQGEVPLEWNKAKLCSLFHADEMINSDWFIPSKKDHEAWVIYWEEFKEEVKNL